MKTLTVELPDELAQKLEFIEGQTPSEKIKSLLRQAGVLGLKECYEVISHYEAQYGMDFETFRAAWEVGQIVGKHTHSVERDLMEWEGYVLERETWLSLLRELKP
jgi:hypothetical protein